MRGANKPSEELWVCHMGLVPYADGLVAQGTLRARRQADEIPDTLLLLEHPAVYTRGRRSGAGDLPFGEDFYRAKGIDVIATDRGGQLTYHAPGQLVGYPIMRIHDVGRHLRTMEGAIVAMLAEEGIAARSRHDDGIDYTGVWVDDRKIASIGVHVARGVTTHGFAVNVENDLDPFSWVIACGLPDVRMTSIATEAARSDPQHADYDSAAPGPARTGSATGAPRDTAAGICAERTSRMACVRRRMAFSFCEAHGRRQRLVTPTRLGIDIANPSRRAPERAPIDAIPPAPVEAVPA
jgi:lipoyl(octanoyl) transferase